MYLTYNDYSDLGGTLDVDEEIYARFELKARRLMDRATRGRLASESPVRDCVKYCMLELIDAMYADEAFTAAYAGRDIASMSNDGVSVSFAAGSQNSAAQDTHARYLAKIRAWLDGETTSSGVSLLYAGVDA